MEWAHLCPLFHWGFIPWAIYTVPAIPIAYMLNVERNRILRISAACEEGLPRRGRERTKTVIDVLVVLGLLGGTSTSLGLGVPFVSALVTELLGVPDSIIMKLGLLAVWTAIFGASAYYGLKKGIKVLADINTVLAVFAILFILSAGPCSISISGGESSHDMPLSCRHTREARLSSRRIQLNSLNTFAEPLEIIYWMNKREGQQACRMISGTIDLILEVVASDLEAFGEFIDGELLSLPAVNDASSSTVLKVVKPKRTMIS